VTERVVKGLKGGMASAAWDLKKGAAVLKAPVTAFTRLPRLALPPKEPQFMQIDISLPETVSGGTFPFILRQFHRGREIGRLTYLIELPRMPKGGLVAGKGPRKG
jgi:hypothetical protein